MALPPAPPSAAPRLQIKRGDTLALDCQALEAVGGPPRDLTGWGIRSQVRNHARALLAELIVTLEAGVEGRYTLITAPGATDAWAPGQARMDIQYTDPAGVVQSTETVLLSVLADETQ